MTDDILILLTVIHLEGEGSSVLCIEDFVWTNQNASFLVHNNDSQQEAITLELQQSYLVVTEIFISS